MHSLINHNLIFSYLLVHMNEGQPPCDELLALLGDEQPALTRLLTAPTLQDLNNCRNVTLGKQFMPKAFSNL